MRHTFLRASALSLAIASCAVNSPTLATERPALTLGVNSLGSGWDPAENPLAVEMRIWGSIFDTLIARDRATEAKNPAIGAALVPQLATSWKRIDGRTLEIELRRGVKFHNGDEFTADDVAFTFSPERIFAEKAMLPGGKKYFDCFEPVQVIDPYKVRIIACKDDPVLELRLAHYAASIVNKRAYTTLGQKGFRRAPVGTGPVKFVEWKDGVSASFVPNDTYFGGAPNFSKITYREVPEAAARVAGLVAGDYDIISQINPDQFPAIQSAPGRKVLPALLEQMQIFWVNGSLPAIADKRIRQAMAISIDRKGIVEAIWKSMTNPENQFQIPALGQLYDANRKGFPFDQDRARKLLKEAGYKGDPVTIRVIANYYVHGETVAQAIQSMWQEVGFNAKLEIVENWNQAFAPGAAAVMGGCGFEIPAPESLASCFFGDQALARQRGFPKGVAGLDEEALKLAVNDPAKRKQVFGSMLDIFEDEVPAIPLYRTPQFYAGKTTVQWTPTPDFRTDFRKDSLLPAALN